MTERQKAIALAISVTLNVVLIAAVAGGLYFAQRTFKDRIDRAGGSLFEIAKTLPQAEQDRLRESMRGAADQAKPEFRASREHRKKAARLAASPAFDRNAVLDELSRANAAEMRGRGTLDNQLTTAMAALSPESRAKLAPVLEHRSRGLRGKRDRKRDRGPDGPPPPATEAR